MLARWLLALVAWVVEASDVAVGAITLIWAITLVLGLLTLDHSVASAVGAWRRCSTGR